MRPITFNRGAKRSFDELPTAIQVAFIASLRVVAAGEVPIHAKALKGFGSADVLELRENDRAGTYRVVYTVRFEEAVYVLHAFQKKSKTGIKTDQQTIELIRRRLKWAEDGHNEWIARRQEGKR